MHKVPAKRIGDALGPRGIVDHEGIAVASGVISGGRGGARGRGLGAYMERITSRPAYGTAAATNTPRSAV
jgi:hypothetical protein